MFSKQQTNGRMSDEASLSTHKTKQNSKEEEKGQE